MTGTTNSIRRLVWALTVFTATFCAAGSMAQQANQVVDPVALTASPVNPELLTGTWHYHHQYVPGVLEAKGITIYTAPGKARYETYILINGTKRFVESETQFTINDGVMTTTVVSSSDPTFLKVGMTSSARILELTASTFRYQDVASGFVQVELRTNSP